MDAADRRATPFQVECPRERSGAVHDVDRPSHGEREGGAASLKLLDATTDELDT
jgi:hypothetical protein